MNADGHAGLIALKIAPPPMLAAPSGFGRGMPDVPEVDFSDDPHDMALSSANSFDASAPEGCPTTNQGGSRIVPYSNTETEPNASQESKSQLRVSWPEPISASELCEAPPHTPAVLIEGVLYRGGTMLISGPSKSHKTYTMLDAACAIAEGRPWLGLQTAKTPVLYVNLELQDFAVAKRLEQICHAENTKPSAGLHLWNLRGHRVTLGELTGKLPTKIKEFGAGFVVIDPHYKVSAVSGMEENSNDSQGMLLSALEGLCSLNDAALAVCHHFAKGDASAKTAIDRASGGGVFARWGDVMLTFTPHEEAEAMTVEMSLRNFAPVAPFVVKWDHPRWTRDGQLDPSKLKRAGAKEKHSAGDALRALGSKTLGYAEWQKATDMSDTTFRRKRNELIKARKVEQVGNLFRAMTV